MKITGIYLAAGYSERMGVMNKLTLKLGNKEMGRWGLERAIDSNLDEIIIVAQDRSALDLSGLSTKNVTTIEITECREGQSHSLKTGLKQAYSLNSDAVVVLLADQPFITTQMINELLQIYKKNPTTSFVASTFHDIVQPPVLIANHLFPKILLLKGDQGAKQVLKGKMEQGILLPFYDEQLFTDIDYMEEYVFWKKQVESIR
ncbi:nucleotidyltransferase family protein [Peribacillus sp. NPDC097675]|uniref:nucleotidyltransferase family protein n=1 Tax=Peribacillus sp. NPDC097675 TaxID=3390618 RepID=UPI003D07CD53